jgi:hypothetical protein
MTRVMRIGADCARFFYVAAKCTTNFILKEKKIYLHVKEDSFLTVIKTIQDRHPMCCIFCG